MSDFLSAAAAALPGVPEQLVLRSASARATAQGLSTDDVLQSWGGGGALAPAPVGAPSPAPAAPVTSAAAAPAPAAVPTATATAVAEAPVVIEPPEEAEEPIDPPSLAARLLEGLRMGIFVGTIGGLAAALFGVQETFDAMGVTDGVATVPISPGPAIIATAAILAVTGAVISRVSLSVPVLFDRNFRTEDRPAATVLIGVVTGAVFGAALGAFLIGRGFADATDESIVHLPAVSSFLLTLLGGSLVGGLTGMVAQMSALPAGLGEEERADAVAVRRRLVTGYLTPVLVLVTMVVLVVSIGTILVEFRALAPLIAIVVAAAVLAFGFLSGGRPKIRVGRTEVFVALAGIAVLVYFLVLIANAMFGGSE